jgi:hypothetical protein
MKLIRDIYAGAVTPLQCKTVNGFTLPRYTAGAMFSHWGSIPASGTARAIGRMEKTEVTGGSVA